MELDTLPMVSAAADQAQGAEAVQQWVQRGLLLAEALYQVLRLDIITGVIKTGERLRERDLSTRYGVSRTPVREVLHRLSSEGFLTLTNRGLAVTDASAAEVMDGWAVREEMMCIIVRLAIERAWTEDLQQLRQLVERLKEAVRSDDQMLGIKLALAFDEGLFRAAHSRPALRVFSASIGPPGRVARTLGNPARLAAASEEREAILNAVASRDLEAAIAAVREHARAGRENPGPTG